jgi:hypothetical protein
MAEITDPEIKKRYLEMDQFIANCEIVAVVKKSTLEVYAKFEAIKKAEASKHG